VADEDIALSPDFCEALTALRSLLAVLETHLPLSLFSRVWRRIASRLDSFIVQQVTENHHFQAGAPARLDVDVHALYLVFQPYTEEPAFFFPRFGFVCVCVVSCPLFTCVYVVPEPSLVSLSSMYCMPSPSPSLFCGVNFVF
jgi:RINT-1/TIP-1 family